jgi:hypothetical protein
MFKFSTRHFFLAMLFVSILLTALVLPGVAVRKTIGQLKLHGVDVWELDSTSISRFLPQFGRYWVRVAEVEVPGRLLGSLPNVVRADFEVAGNQFQSLMSQLKELESIEVMDSTGLDSKSLLAAPRLTSISLHGKNFEGLDLGDLRSLHQLTSLDLSYSGVSDKSLEKVGMLNQIRRLDLSYTEISDKGLEMIVPLQLVSLNVSGNQLTDSCLSNLANMTVLRELSIQCSEISEQRLSVLSKGTFENSLRQLVILSLVLDSNGENALRKSLPNCNIYAPITFTSSSTGPDDDPFESIPLEELEQAEKSGGTRE